MLRRGPWNKGKLDTRILAVRAVTHLPCESRARTSTAQLGLTYI
jgi:hypothetical protein